jgi:hypothetical protein
MTKALSARISDYEVQKVAHQMLRRHAGEAAMRATQEANRAFTQDHMFNYDLWNRIAKAVQKLNREKPG